MSSLGQRALYISKICALNTDGVSALYINMGWSGGAKVLGKLPVPACPTNLDYSSPPSPPKKKKKKKTLY